MGLLSRLRRTKTEPVHPDDLEHWVGELRKPERPTALVIQLPGAPVPAPAPWSDDDDLDEGYAAGLDTSDLPSSRVCGCPDGFDEDFGGGLEDWPGLPLRGWARRGEPYNHFRTLKILDKPRGYVFTVKGRSGKRRHTGDFGYAHKQDAKKAALRWVERHGGGIPTRWVDEQYGGAVVVDMAPDLALAQAQFKQPVLSPLHDD